ncbi:MAG: 2-oxoglutarate/2-oxoacid ferredoxin oxidoreductase subunit beta, partial [Patescibacteria group bacterium]|nr:2-oxoglutarate/2-oxoacid ferredoxin oxidoreductase subunit beta [Patescibacteria group bacterium]
AIRGNVNVTYVVHDNKVYGLTTGQTAPTSDRGFKTKTTPQGTLDDAVNPIALSLAQGISFVARGFSGQAENLKHIFKAAIQHEGFALVDVFQPCVTFNKVNTFQWFFDKIYNLDEKKDYNKADFQAAMKEALVWGEKIPVGIFYQANKPEYISSLPQLKGMALAKRPMKVRDISKLLYEFK